MLADPAEAAHHANILMALAGSSHAGAYEAIARWAVLPRTGEVDRDTFRAWQVLPHALGTLSKRDGRALDLLESQLESQPGGWRFRHHDADQVAQLTRRAAATGLARSGLPRAEALLRAAEQRATDAAFRRHLRKARDLHQRRREGVAR